MLVRLDGAIPDSDEGEAKKQTEGSSDLGDHGGGRVQELLPLDGGVPRLGEQRKDKLIVG